MTKSIAAAVHAVDPLIALDTARTMEQSARLCAVERLAVGVVVPAAAMLTCYRPAKGAISTEPMRVFAH